MKEVDGDQFDRMLKERSAQSLDPDEQLLNEIRRITDKLTGEELDAIRQMIWNWRTLWGCGC